MTQPWKDFEMVIDVGSEGTYDTTHSLGPSVIKDGSTYKMWYEGSVGSYGRVIYCDSTDGKNWSNFQMVINHGAEGTYDSVTTGAPTVIKDGSIYKMWRTGWNGSNVRIIYCDSLDGKNWSNHQMVINHGAEGANDAEHSSHPSVILDGSTYKMWYSGGAYGSNWRIIYCDSSDGKNWSNFQMVVNIGAEGTYDTVRSYEPTVIKDDSTYRMWYDGNGNRIIYCDSTDGKSWSNHQMVVNYGSEGTYDTSYIESPTVILDGSTYKMWYTGHDSSHYRIIYCDYKALSISGQLSDDARIIIIDKSDWSIVGGGEKLAGSYIVTTTSGEKLVVAIKPDGQSVSYGNIIPA